MRDKNGIPTAAHSLLVTLLAPLIVIGLFAAFVLLVPGCVAPRPVPTQPDGGLCSSVQGDCDTCEQRCDELAEDGQVILEVCLEECS